MNLEELKNRTGHVTELCHNVFKRIQKTLDSLFKLNSSFVEKELVHDLYKQFYLMVIDEYNLLLLLINDISNNPKFIDIENEELGKIILNINNTLKSSVEDCKSQLLQMDDYKKQSIKGNTLDKSIPSVNKLLGIIGK